MNFKSAFRLLQIKSCTNRISSFSILTKDFFDLNVKKSSLFNIKKCMKNQNLSNTDSAGVNISIEPNPYQVDIDLNQNPQASYDDALEDRNDIPFKYNELVVCKVFSDGKNNYSTRMLILKKNGIFTLNNFNIFHEHIIYKSHHCQHIRKQNLNVAFRMFSRRFEFKRPTLYEYAQLKSQTAVSSHFSILTLAPVLLELGRNTKVLECGTGSGTMTLFLSQHLGKTGLLHTFDQHNEKVSKAKGFFWDWKNSFDLSVISSNDKWPCNVKFGVVDFCNHIFNEKFESIILKFS